MTSTFPFPVQLKIHFKNFFPETGSTDSVKIDEEVFGDDWVDIVKTIADHQFKHSSGNDTISIDDCKKARKQKQKPKKDDKSDE